MTSSTATGDDSDSDNNNNNNNNTTVITRNSDSGHEGGNNPEHIVEVEEDLILEPRNISHPSSAHSSSTHQLHTRTSFECHPYEILNAIADVSGLSLSGTNGGNNTVEITTDRSNPQDSLPRCRQHHPPTIVETALAGIVIHSESNATTVALTRNDDIDVVCLIDKTILRQTGQLRRRRGRRCQKS
mmetsp:Transcript_22981/g.66350  ORF Transcript_22981/g.66350 Transcript_22981/m.66350 type:complete len:186 (+) Transcript_22981:250-807(+)